MSSRRSTACWLIGLTGLFLALVTGGVAAADETATGPGAAPISDQVALSFDPVDGRSLTDQAPVVAKRVEAASERVAAAWDAAPDSAHARAASGHPLGALAMPSKQRWRWSATG